MNEEHLKICSSDEWGEVVERFIFPWVFSDGVSLGDAAIEVGPGPGRATDLLNEGIERLTVVEIDASLASQLAARLGEANVVVTRADATRLPFASASFSGAACFTMLHHVPSAELQDRLLREVCRVLQPGAVFVGVDSLDSDDFRALHVGDICVPLDPGTFAGRLSGAGFAEASVTTNEFGLRFSGRARG